MTAAALAAAVLVALTGCEDDTTTDNTTDPPVIAIPDSGEDDELMPLTDMKGLSLADAWNQASGAGFWVLTAYDQTGRQRTQEEYTAWVVCEHAPEAGLYPSSTVIDFAVVKRGESCAR